MTPPKTYEDWLALSDSERKSVKETWNAYRREGVGFVYCAAGRLAISSSFPIYQVQAGTYHGGEWVIHAFVDDERIPELPNCWDATFAGFRIYWFPVSEQFKNKQSQA
jgi:hypothetical protein